jgi:hypothetical protein
MISSLETKAFKFRPVSIDTNEQVGNPSPDPGPMLPRMSFYQIYVRTLNELTYAAFRPQVH